MPAKTGRFSVMTLNLHAYQENNQEEKFDLMALVISELDIDFITFQECAQHKNSGIIETVRGVGIHSDNMMHQIALHLKSRQGKDYLNYYWDWAHYGWNIWEEGVAVMAKSDYPLLETESRYLCDHTDRLDIDSRLAVYGAFRLDPKTRLHLFSVHNSWGGLQNTQLDHLKQFAEEKAPRSSETVILAGDYNMSPRSPGYKHFLSDQNYTDTYLTAHPEGNEDMTALGGERIDYIFLREGSPFRTESSRVLFAGKHYEHVSDHFAVLTTFVRK